MVSLGTPWQELVGLSAGYRARTLEALFAAFEAAGRTVPSSVLAVVRADLLREARDDGSCAPIAFNEVYFDRDGFAHVDREVPPAPSAIPAAEDVELAPRSFVRACVDAIAGGPGEWRLTREPVLSEPPVIVDSCPIVQDARPVYRHVISQSRPVSLLAAPPARLGMRMEATARSKLERSRMFAVIFVAALLAAATASIAVFS